MGMIALKEDFQPGGPMWMAFRYLLANASVLNNLAIAVSTAAIVAGHIAEDMGDDLNVDFLTVKGQAFDLYTQMGLFGNEGVCNKVADMTAKLVGQFVQASVTEAEKSAAVEVEAGPAPVSEA